MLCSTAKPAPNFSIFHVPQLNLNLVSEVSNKIINKTLKHKIFVKLLQQESFERLEAVVTKLSGDPIRYK